MKKMLNSLMFVAAAAMAFAGCSKEEVSDNAQSGSGIKTTRCFVAEIAESRTTLNDAATRMKWTAGDQLGFYTDVTTDKNVASSTYAEGATNFTASIDTKATKVYAYYPYYAGQKPATTHEDVSLYIEDAQTQAEAGVLNGNMVGMYASATLVEGENTVLTFTPIASLLAFNIYDLENNGDAVKSVTFTPAGGELLNGQTIYNMETGVTASTGSKTSATVTLTTPHAVPSAKPADKAGYIYLAVSPKNYASGGTFTVKTDKGSYDFVTTKAIDASNVFGVFTVPMNLAKGQLIDDNWKGSGSLEDPYQIATARDLQHMASRCNDETENAGYADKHYRQISDIDLSNVELQPIGQTEQTAFKGSYDGGSCTISGLTLSTTGACGLFGYLDGATVTDVHLKGCEYTAAGLHAGGIAGVAKNSSISGCSFDGSIVGSVETEFDGYAVSNVGGFVGYALDSEIAGCALKGSIRALSQIGGIAGYTSGTKLSGCTIESSATIDAEKYFVGGIAGRARYNSVIEDCVVSGKISSYNGNYIGGITGHLTSGRVCGCTITRQASLSSKGNHTGGIVGAVQPNEEKLGDGSNRTAIVENCENAIMVFGGQNVGGIVGYQGTATADHTSIVRGCVAREAVTGYSYSVGGISGTISSVGDSFIENCQSYGDITSSLYQVGGICGYAVSQGETTIDYCIAYGNCRGQYGVGGICGYAKSNLASCVINVVNCMYAGEEVEATGNNGKNGYTLATGLIGWLQVASGSANVVNCASRVQTVKTASKSGQYASTNDTLSGILGFQNGVPAAANLYGLYSTVEKSGFLTDGEVTTSTYYGGIYSKIHSDSYSIITLKHCYYNPAAGQAGPGMSNLSKVDKTTVGAYGEMSALLTDLNAAVAAYDGTCGRTLKSWTLDADGYPVIEGMTTLLSASKTKRISVIGDSISTFRGFVPSGYGCHYPTADYDLTSVSQTYWYRLAHDLMSDARIERNISFSGTAVTRTTNPAYSSQSWYGKDFCARFIAQGGVGRPDIVLIHGGTNDYAHNVDKLAPNIAIQSADAPSDAVLAELFAAADAATTRAEIEALDDTTFCTAYIKLIRLLRERYPNVKIVCIIGDYLSTGIEQSTIKIAEHYGAKSVDLYAVNGYNDQTYMPKHDYNPATGKGCHPSSEAMAFIADKIYTELGSWLEE